MSGSPHQDRREDIAAYALGALEPNEADELERHLAGCEECSEYLSWLGPAVDLLPASVEQVDAPASLREGLMATVRSEAAAERDAVAATEARPPRESRWTWGGPMLRPATVLAAVAVLAVGAAVGYLVSDGGDCTTRETIQAQAVGSVPASQLVASVEHGAGGDAILHVERAPALANGDVYQAWVARDGATEPVASFRPGEDGTAETALGDNLEGADEVLVTKEPTPNEDRPTSAPILRAELH